MATTKKTTPKTTRKRSISASAKTKLAKAGTAIMTAAKKIRKENPRKKWTTCVKEAGLKYKKSK